MSRFYLCYQTGMWDVINMLAEKLGAKEHARLKWRTRGIPTKYHLPLLQLAGKLKIRLPESALTQKYPASKRKGNAA